MLKHPITNSFEHWLSCYWLPSISNAIMFIM